VENIYKPHLVRIEEKRMETYDTTSFKLVFVDDEVRENFSYQAGNFGEYSVFGEGESTFCIASSPTRKDYIECCFRAAGRLTHSLAQKEVGDIIGFRGPYGNHFPIDDFFGKNVVFIAGGIALPPVRSVIWNILDLRDKFQDVTIVYGARTVADLVYKHELKDWEARDNVNLVSTVDPGGETEDWTGQIGFVPNVLKETAPKAEHSVAVLCGPPIMIKFTLPVLKELGFREEDVWTTLENRMKCGLGKCGRCNVGDIYVCKEGPVFTAADVGRMPNDF